MVENKDPVQNLAAIREYMPIKLGSIVGGGGRGEDRARKVTTHPSWSAPAIMIGTFPNGIVCNGSDLEDKMIVVEEL
jgi:hypothetical protein